MKKILKYFGYIHETDIPKMGYIHEKDLELWEAIVNGGINNFLEREYFKLPPVQDLNIEYDVKNEAEVKEVMQKIWKAVETTSQKHILLKMLSEINKI